MNNNIFIGAFLLGSVLVCSSGQAYLIDDNYYGGVILNDQPTKDDYDIAGDPQFYNVSRLTVDVDLYKMVTVKIYSEFLNNIGIPGGTSIKDGFEKLIQLGDLFISTDDWTPDGLAKDYYNTDVAGGEDWEYALVLNNREYDREYNRESGQPSNTSLFKVDTRNDIIVANYDLAPEGNKTGQEVLYNTTGKISIDNSGSWFIYDNGTSSDNDDYLQIVFNSSGIPGGLDIDNFALHWTMTCANDVIEGGSPVPEPTTMLLFGTGLIGLAGSALRRKKK